MITRLTYKQVSERHPEELKTLIEMVGRSRSKHKDKPVEEWRFCYSWTVPRDASIAYYASYSSKQAEFEDKIIHKARDATIHVAATPNPMIGATSHMVFLMHGEVPDEVLMRIIMDELKAEKRFNKMDGSDWATMKMEIFVRARKQIPGNKPIKPKEEKKERKPQKRDKWEAVKI